jgi:hypothetical protein
MSIFQKSLVTKYINKLDKDRIAEKWAIFKNHFLNPEIQANIRISKEEQYQGEFLIDLFVNVLGYTKNPSPNFNLTTEYKNEKDSKKADGAIIISNQVVAVIELKGTNTTDLQKIEMQAFGYKNNQKDCIYVITSNFEKLRFYIDNAIEHEEFNLFTLDEKKFEILYLCLAYENISKNIPKKLKEESINQEDIITKQLYKDYSAFKHELFNNLTTLNPNYDVLELFKKSQKLIDRFLFIFFAEDRQLLQPNSVRTIIEQWKQLKDLDEYVPLYDRFKKYFGYLNTGYKSKQLEVYPYNGGLFREDEVLDNLSVNDELLFKHTLRLSEYDFASEVDVNILGHIFENSLNELDEMKARLEGVEIDKGKTKRKKDGVYYTPKYITKYIVENTVGKLCDEKKQVMRINDEDFAIETASTKLNYSNSELKEIKHKLLDKLKTYRSWLLELKIIDPACGSGAFLNEALNFLIAEHQYIDELENKLLGGGIVFPNIEVSILENNLFGVDINEESVEIAKLSLWLRTAQPNRKLSDLSKNIKCGNSLIDDPEIAGEKAFKWEKEFPQVFFLNKSMSKGNHPNVEDNNIQEVTYTGGFDVVIGNPPWGATISKNDINYLKDKGYSDTTYNTAYLFIERSLGLINSNGCLSFIIPKGLSYVPNLRSMRKFLLDHYSVELIVDVSEAFQQSDVELECMIIRIVNKNEKAEVITGYYSDNNFTINDNVYSDIVLTSENFAIWMNNNNIGIARKIMDSSTFLGEICTSRRGININRYVSAEKEDIIVLGGKNITRYGIDFFSYCKEEYIKEIHNWQLTPKLILQEIVGRYGKPIFGNYRRVRLNSTIDTIGNYYTLDTVVNLFDFDNKFDIKFVLAILNCRLLTWYYHIYQKSFSQLTLHSGNENSRSLPIPKISPEFQQPFIEKADLMLDLNKKLQELSGKFQRLLQNEFSLDTLPKKLQDWYLLTYGDFIQELTKKKVKLTLSQKAEWEDYFLQQQEKATTLKNAIDSTDREIDQLVYRLYDLTEEEIRIVEMGAGG